MQGLTWPFWSYKCQTSGLFVLWPYNYNLFEVFNITYQLSSGNPDDNYVLSSTISTLCAPTTVSIVCKTTILPKICNIICQLPWLVTTNTRAPSTPNSCFHYSHAAFWVCLHALNLAKKWAGIIKMQDFKVKFLSRQLYFNRGQNDFSMLFFFKQSQCTLLFSPQVEFHVIPISEYFNIPFWLCPRSEHWSINEKTCPKRSTTEKSGPSSAVVGSADPEDTHCRLTPGSNLPAALSHLQIQNLFLSYFKVLKT